LVSEILVVEDEPAIAESVAYALGKAGHEAQVATNLKSARERLSSSTDLVLLDLMLPDGSGFDWIAELESERARGLAVIVLSSRDGEADRVKALEMGADDYVTKPFSPREVVARVTAVLRRLATGSRKGERRLVMDTKTRRVRIDGKTLELTRVEFDMLELLYSRPGEVYSRATIIDRVWGAGFALSDRTIDSHIKALRKKLVECGGSAEWIETIRGIGYRIVEEEYRS
jgi:two-component system catabolic regulation response regulator CreB